MKIEKKCHTNAKVVRLGMRNLALCHMISNAPKRLLYNFVDSVGLDQHGHPVQSDLSILCLLTYIDYVSRHKKALISLHLCVRLLFLRCTSYVNSKDPDQSVHQHKVVKTFDFPYYKK